MSQTIVTPPLATTLRRWAVRAWDDPETRSTLIGLAGVLLIHLLLWAAMPSLLRFDPVPASRRPKPVGHDFNIELAPEIFNKPLAKPKDPFKFVETNPEAPENTPDKTNNFAAQNQQVAQEKPTPDGKSDRPATEGKKDFESTQIVSGRLTKPIEHMEAVPPPMEVPPAEQVVAAARAEQNPLSGDEKNPRRKPRGRRQQSRQASGKCPRRAGKSGGREECQGSARCSDRQPARDRSATAATAAHVGRNGQDASGDTRGKQVRHVEHWSHGHRCQVECLRSVPPTDDRHDPDSVGANPARTEGQSGAGQRRHREVRHE